jgi:signal transduction histidine kinase
MAVVVTFISVGVWCPAASAQDTPGKTVLAVFWGSETFPGNGRMDAAIQKVLDSDPRTRVNYFAEYLESEEFPADTASIALRDYIHRKFDGRRVDVVIAVASAALEFVLRYRADLFPGVPIVFISVAVPQAVMERTVPNITGMLSDVPFGETLSLALRLHPSTKRVFVIAHAPSVAGYDERVHSALTQFSNQVELTYVEAQSRSALLAAVRAAAPQSLVLYTRFTSNEAGSFAYPDEIAHDIAEVSPVPVYTVSDLYIGSGVVGGMARTADSIGAGLGEMAMEILHGTPAERIAMAKVPVSPIFDWRQLKRWKIPESRLPQGSQLLFKTPTTWELYHWYIVSAVFVVVAQLMLISGLLTQRTQRRKAENILRTNEESLRTSYDRTRHLASRLIHVQETTHARIARDLHDDVCQRLAGITMMTDILKKSSGRIQDVAAQQTLADIATEVRHMFTDMRQLSHDLHPDLLRVVGLVSTLKAHCAEVAERNRVHVSFTATGELGLLPPDIAVCLFRVAQESLRNGVVHGRARRLGVSLMSADGSIELSVTDDGCGFDVEAVRRTSCGLGLVSIEERAQAVGGSSYIVTEIGSGTRVHVRCPVVAHAAPIGAPGATVATEA